MIKPASIPLALYVHLPWCKQKCPYCDFNSHEGFSPTFQQPYVEALLSDLDSQLEWLNGRPIRSIFIGGGTPSLFDGEWIARLLGGIGDRLTLSGDAEITLESNPNSADAEHFKRYRRAGINRLSIGVQTFHDHALQRLGRLHSGDEARHALDHIPGAGFDRWNIDLIHGLPGQNATMAEADVAEAIERSAGHISWYQLTIERNTRFWSAPPTLPGEDELERIQSRGEEMFQTAGFLQYEVSAYSRKFEESRHNLNYWQFGDYVGLGAGAHGKVTRPAGDIVRTHRTRLPNDYLKLNERAGMAPPATTTILPHAVIGEFAMNALRLKGGVSLSDFTDRTGLLSADLVAAADEAISKGWVANPAAQQFVATELGFQFLDSTVATFV
jgi:oxygen-independent coproporphyrinogen-3 oxidase